MSQTFIVNEISALEQLGVEVEIFSLSRSDDPVVQAEVAQLAAPVTYLDGAPSGGAPLRHPLLAAGVANSRRQDVGYHAADRFECFRMASRLNDLMRQRRASERPLSHLHAHFAHDPAAVASLAARMAHIPFSFTAHARDLYQLDQTVLRNRCRHASSVVTICRANAAYLADHGIDDAKVKLVYNGIRPTDFRRRCDHAGPLRMISVARLVEKKGMFDLLDVAAQLATSGLDFSLRVFGDGPLERDLIARRDRLGLSSIVEFCGARPRYELVDELASSDLFVLLPFVTDDGDRDGIPTVYIEAMASRLPVVSTDVVGVPELVEHAGSGLLVAPRDVAEASTAIMRLAHDRELRERLGLRGEQIVGERFTNERAARELISIFEASRQQHRHRPAGRPR